MPRAFVWVCFLLVVVGSFSTNLIPFFFYFLMAPKREMIASRAQSKHPAQTEARQKVRFDTTLFMTVEDYQRYKQKFA